jgi:hypothetical protein
MPLKRLRQSPPAETKAFWILSPARSCGADHTAGPDPLAKKLAANFDAKFYLN